MQQLLCCCSSSPDAAIKGSFPVSLEQQSVLGEQQEVFFTSPDRQSIVKPAEDEVRPVQSNHPNARYPTLPSVPPAGPLQFVVFFEKGTSGRGLGLDVDITDGPTLLIDAVTDGLIKIWNDANPASEIKPRDRFLEVNGVRGDAKSIIEELNRAQVFTIVVARPLELTLNVKKPNDQAPLGIALSYCAGGCTLLVVLVNPGLIGSWNKQNQDRMLEKDDRIFEVNGISGDAKTVYDMLISSDSLEVKFIKALRL